MEMFYIGLATSAVITITVSAATFIAFKWGYKAGLSVKKTTKEEVNEKELLEIKRRQQGLKNIMDYDYSKAIERGVK